MMKVLLKAFSFKFHASFKPCHRVIFPCSRIRLPFLCHVLNVSDCLKETKIELNVVLPKSFVCVLIARNSLQLQCFEGTFKRYR